MKISRLATDSRLISPGDTFLAYYGERQDGRKFIPEAIKAGANAVLWEPHGFKWDSAWGAPNRRAEAESTGRAHRQPCIRRPVP